MGTGTQKRRTRLFDGVADPFGGWNRSADEHSDTAAEQLSYLVGDLRFFAKNQPLRYWTVAFSAPFVTTAAYRLERAAFLALGRGFVVARAVAAPIRLLLRPLRHGCELQYTAQIGPRFQLQHPNMGATISGRVVIGANVTLAGGNAIGSRRRAAGHGDVVIGDGVTIGMNATIFGPLKIGDGALIGAGAVVVRDVEPGQRVAGVPARPVGEPSTD